MKSISIWLAFVALILSSKSWAASEISNLPDKFPQDSEDHFLQPVPLEDVELEKGSQFDKAVALNREYLLGIDNDRFLRTFRLNAGLPAPGENFTGSWEDPTCEVRGQFMGHWLSGTAMLGRHSGDQEILDKASYIINELRKVQVKIGSGYLSAFPFEHFERLRALQGVWAPFYVIHKIMAGLLDHYTFLGNKLALQMVEEEAAFFLDYIEDIYRNEGKAHWIQMLEVEYGGMEEVLFNLYGVTGNETYANGAAKFTKPNWYDPLLKGEDALPGRHANTHLAQVNGFAAGFEKFGSKARRHASANFFNLIVTRHSYATGGNNDGEFWQTAQELGSTIAADGAGLGTEETCTTYNMLKLARYLFRWTADPKFVDYYERALLNGMLGTQRMPADYNSSIFSISSRSNLEIPASLGEFPVQNSGDVFQARNSSEQINLQQNVSTGILGPELVQMTNSEQSWRQKAFEQFPGNNLPEWSNKPGPGVIIYLLPLGAGNTKNDNFHHWSTPLNSFWCCSGSIAESFGKLMDSIYFQRIEKGKPPQLYINQFAPSKLFWRAANVTVVLKTVQIAENNTIAVRISTKGIGIGDSDLVLLQIRIPAWAEDSEGKISYKKGSETKEETIAKDSKNYDHPGYWPVGIVPSQETEIEMWLKMSIRTEAINDHRPEYQNLQAVMMGPYLMAALTDHDRNITLNPKDVGSHVFDVDRNNLFTLRSENGLVLRQNGKNLRFSSEEECLSKMDCTFRILPALGISQDPKVEILKLEGTEMKYVIESMSFPGFFAGKSKKGNGSLLHVGDSYFQNLEEKDTSSRRNLVFENGSFNFGDVKITLEEPKGVYPDYARLLKGSDKSYVIAPIGHLVEERYSPYLRFTDPLKISK